MENKKPYFLKEFDSFSEPKEARNPSCKVLNRENIIKLSLLQLERSDFSIYDFDKSFEEFITSLENISKTSQFKLKERDINILQFGISKFKNSEEFHRLIGKEKYEKLFETALNKILIRKSVNKKIKIKLLNVIYLIFPDFVNKKIKEYVNKNIDLRVTNHLKENIWLMEKLDFNNDHQNIVLDFIHTTELEYRKSIRKNERNQHNENQKELTFNHFLRVMRISLGMVNSSKFKNFAEFSPENLNKKKELFKLSLIALGHDLIEDDVYEKDKLLQIITNICDEYSIENTIINEITNSIDRLNSYNYLNEDGTRDYNTFLFGNPAKNVRPLNTKEKIVKIADIFHNYQSTIKITGKEDKIETYAKFINDNIELVKLLPNRIIKNVFKHNPIIIKYDGWINVYKLIKTDS